MDVSRDKPRHRMALRKLPGGKKAPFAFIVNKHLDHTYRLDAINKAKALRFFITEPSALCHPECPQL